MCHGSSCRCITFVWSDISKEAQADVVRSTYFHLLALRLFPGRLAVFVGAGGSNIFFQSELQKAGEAHKAPESRWKSSYSSAAEDSAHLLLLLQASEKGNCWVSTDDSNEYRGVGNCVHRPLYIPHTWRNVSVGRFFTNPRSHACHGKVETKMQHGPLLWDSRGPSLWDFKHFHSFSNNLRCTHYMHS